MKKKKMKLHFDKKVISNLTKIQGGYEPTENTITLSNMPDAQSVCLCNTTTAHTDTCLDTTSSLLCNLISKRPGLCLQTIDRC